jgi:hypothetical protein
LAKPTIFRAARRNSVPWKNGGGVTSEIAAFPEASSTENFGWRISTALVETAGPFSDFGNIDRNLIVLEGRLALQFSQNNREVILGPGQSFSFAGDAAVTGIPIGGPVRDLNVMVRRGEWQAEVTTARPQQSGNETLIAIATQPATGLATLDAMQLDNAAQLPADFDGYFVCLQPEAGR